MKFDLNKIYNSDRGIFLVKYVPFPVNEGTIEELGDDKYFSFVDHGVECIINSKGELASLLFHSDGHEGYKGYRRELPHELKFQQDHDTVCKQLGNPVKSHAPIPLIGVPYGETYEFDDHNFSVFYSNDKKSILYCQITLEVSKA